MPENPSIQELFELVRKIPYGRVVSYGSLGRSLSRPVSGLLVGKWMARIPRDLPWWRVVSKSGHLAISNRDIALGLEQMERLKREGVNFIGDEVEVIEFMINAENLPLRFGFLPCISLGQELSQL